MQYTIGIILNGKNSKAFDKYQKTPATKAEILYFKRAEKFYKMHQV